MDDVGVQKKSVVKSCADVVNVLRVRCSKAIPLNIQRLGVLNPFTALSFPFGIDGRDRVGPGSR